MPNLLYRLPAAAAVLAIMPSAAPAEALPDRDTGPLAGLYGFPDSRDGGRVLEPGRRHVALTLRTSSHAVRDEHGEESLLLDGETNRITLGWRRGVAGRLELGLEVPYVLHESGSLDSLIDDWHGFFNLPKGIRDELPEDRLLFRYRSADGEALRLDRNVHGLGDVRLTAAWQLEQTALTHTAVRVGIKLPTGDSERLLGSGSADISIGLARDRRELAGLPDVSGFWRINATYIGSPDVPSPRTKRVVGQLAAGIAWRAVPRLELAAQARLRSRVYESSLAPAGDVAASLTVGANIRLSRRYEFSVAVAEDIHVRSLPDVTFAVGLTWRGTQPSSGL